ncbi:MAG: UDP-N-acetylmuramoyl-tripeptide--D-alanyl-D-alanine ligase [Clostridia bacterium]|nr:UDP-N-acetylmuramoyl-tripeptide--D-alanyl-D-alanine ligase [Clostridia bacterium]
MAHVTPPVAEYPPGWTVAELARATGASRLSVAGDDLRFTRVTTDSREARPGTLFVALRGERVDGHDFVADAVARGAVAALVEREVDLPEGRRAALLLVDDAVAALGRFAHWHRRRFRPRVAAVTGSVGKTSCKDMALAVVREAGGALASAGNLNSHVGLPLSLLSIGAEHEYVVLELAMRGPGEIGRLARLAEPEVGVLTRIAESHLGRLGSLAAIAEAKFELVRALPPTGLAILNADDPMQRERAGESRAPVLWYGLGEGPRPPDVTATAIRSRGAEGLSFRLRTPRGEAEVELPLPGRHQIANALAAAAIGHAFGLPPDALARGLARVVPSGMRSEVREAGRLTIIDDAYNASPTSLAAALALLLEVAGGRRRVAVLGDMLELGPEAPRLHEESGRLCADLDGLVTVGDLAWHLGRGAVAAGLPIDRWVHAQSLAACALTLRAVVRPGDVVLVKASRGMHFEELVAELERGWIG